MEYNVKSLGQVFTPKNIVSLMLSLKRNNGRVLEPSCGDGAFSDELPSCVAIEIDSTKAPSYALNIDFFSYDIQEKFDTIIGNPPYVRFQDIQESTKKLLNMDLFDERSNLYMFFIHKCIQHLKPNGELIFITPRDFLKATSSIKLNQYIYEQGTITDVIDLGDKIIFKNYSPNCLIFRFQKGDFSRKTNIIKSHSIPTTKTFCCINGQLLFVSNSYTIPFSELFFVKVGAVSGADKYFLSENGNMEFVYSETRKTGKTRTMFYNTPSKELLPFKEQLMKRKIRKFNEDNWFEWGRKFYESDSDRIYVNCKTRMKNPFFIHPCKNYDGSILAIFPKVDMDIEKAVHLLNKVDWEELGFMCEDRYLFSQKSLENCMLPDFFEELIHKT